MDRTQTRILSFLPKEERNHFLYMEKDALNWQELQNSLKESYESLEKLASGEVENVSAIEALKQKGYTPQEYFEEFKSKCDSWNLDKQNADMQYVERTIADFSKRDSLIIKLTVLMFLLLGSIVVSSIFTSNYATSWVSNNLWAIPAASFWVGLSAIAAALLELSEFFLDKVSGWLVIRQLSKIYLYATSIAVYALSIFWVCMSIGLFA